ncbi:glycoside hydrolase family 2 TIM barrel-domain containing protein [Jatrophihabitans endophyticus]|uniref:glycoside hydrolase family 2 TIM barrel-domain containing protein n=1 Tax=Jatrophihabitans endophyticus TaxID=1206085 RepID=UPI0019EE2EE5|nr:glycoside hydrolase family 2 TIM barrel-domain containing protein [Jatrophihabitans endophyticus]MBE7187606.1 DUF4982 domain-containing protein [Jatrophihabitans endophyticus]
MTLPHDAMLFERRDPNTPNGLNTGYYPGGVYHYSKTFIAPIDWEARWVAVQFEGVYTRSEVFLNGKRIGGRPSGYAEFLVELDGLVIGGENLLEVVAHNDRPGSRWYSGSGIYRPVHLLVGGPLRIAADGLRVTTTRIDDDTATVAVDTTVVNDSDTGITVLLKAAVEPAQGGPSAGGESTVHLAAGATHVHTQHVTVPHALLWSMQTPDLYRCTVQVSCDGGELDLARTEFGIRTLTADAWHGLRINGESIKLRGACIHHDNGPIGAHTLEAAEDRRIRILKEAGYNAIRSAHNPVSRATLQACDRHGMLVMDELTDVWWRVKQPYDYGLDFEAWWERDLAAMVAKDFNHPSVIFYSIGNEIAETATTRGIRLNRVIADRTRELDPTRLITNGINGFLNLIASSDDARIAAKAEHARQNGGDPAKNLIAVLNFTMSALEKVLPTLVRLPQVDQRTRAAYAALDVAGYNYMAGRYRRDAKQYPERLIVGTETNPPDTPRVWHEIESLPQVLGEFSWTGWDYIGEAGIAAIEYDAPRRLFKPYPALLAGEPVIDITGFPQPLAHLNQIAWGLRSDPYIAVEELQHSNRKRASNAWRSNIVVHSWSWEGQQGKTAVVEVYADAPTVELLLNGRLIGSAAIGVKQAHKARFEVPYEPGELIAVARTRDGVEIGRDVLRSADPGVLRLLVEPERETITADGADLLYLRIALTDAGGIVRPLADRPVSVEVDGDAALLGFGSAQPVTEEAFATTVHTTYHGRALAVLRAGRRHGSVTVTVRADECAPVTVTVPVCADPIETDSASTRSRPAAVGT